MSLRLKIKQDEGYYSYIFIFHATNYVELHVYVKHEVDISRYESLHKSMIENTQYNCPIDSSYELWMSTRYGYTSFFFANDSHNEIRIELKNELCVEAIKEFIEHRKYH